MKTETLEDLKSRWTQLQIEQPKLRIRDAARELGVSEVELLATNCGDHVRRLHGPWDVLLKEFSNLGHVMCLTRNEAAVHERHGHFRQTEFFHGMGQVVGPDIDLRLFLSHWHLGFSVIDQTPDGPRQSFQFFDQDGTAIHKVYLQNDSNHALFEQLTTRHLHEDQGTGQVVIPLPDARPDKPDSEIDIPAFQTAWAAMQDTHEFFALTRKFGAGRLQSLRLAAHEMARQVSAIGGRQAIELAAAQHVPIMIFVGSVGTIQIHTGQVNNLKSFGPWFNILDEEFNLHLRQDLVAQVWVVRKPTRDGNVTSIELYDEAGENIALIFGKRKPGELEDPAWREIVRTIEEGA